MACGSRKACNNAVLDSLVKAMTLGELRRSKAIVADFPSLTPEQVLGAIAFYLRNRQGIDKHLEEQDERWRQFQQENAKRHGPLLPRIRGEANSATPSWS